MDFALNADQQQLRETLLRYLGRSYGFDQRAARLRDGNWRRVWADFAELGILGASFPERSGGFGGTAEELAVIMEAFGRHLVTEPFLWTAIVAGGLLEESGRAAEMVAEMLEGRVQLALASSETPHWEPARVATRAVPAEGGYRLTGRKLAVFNARIADALIVSARLSGAEDEPDGIGLFLVAGDADGLARRDYRSLDDRQLSDLALSGVRVTSEALLFPADEGLLALERAADRGTASLCAEAIGSMDALLEATAEHLRTREQYGVRLASFQALQHRLADMYAAVELARSMSVVATASITEAGQERARLVSAARVQVIQAARLVSQQAVQLHGGMGVSEEFHVGHHLKHLSLSASLSGTRITTWPVSGAPQPEPTDPQAAPRHDCADC